MKGNVSGYVCNHGSPSGERDTASPRLWAMLRTQASDEEADDVFSRWSFYYGRTGQRMVFLHMYLQTRVTLEAFPVATPRGRSVSFPTRGTMVTYVTWDVIKVNFPLYIWDLYLYIIWKLNKLYFHWCMVCYDRTIFGWDTTIWKSKYWENHL